MKLQFSQKSTILVVTTILLITALTIPAKANNKEKIESINQPNACTYVFGIRYCW